MEPIKKVLLDKTTMRVPVDVKAALRTGMSSYDLMTVMGNTVNEQAVNTNNAIKYIDETADQLIKNEDERIENEIKRRELDDKIQEALDGAYEKAEAEREKRFVAAEKERDEVVRATKKLADNINDLAKEIEEHADEAEESAYKAEGSLNVIRTEIESMKELETTDPALVSAVALNSADISSVKADVGKILGLTVRANIEPKKLTRIKVNAPAGSYTVESNYMITSYFSNTKTDASIPIDERTENGTSSKRDVNLNDTYVYLYCVCNVGGATDIYVKLTSKRSGLETLSNKFTDYFFGKKIGVIGDSIAKGFSLTSSEKPFIDVLADRLGATVKNVGIGSWTFTSEDDGQKGFWRAVDGSGLAGEQRPGGLDGDESLIVVYGGTNDFGHANPIGDLYKYGTNKGLYWRYPSTDDYKETMSGGFHKLIEALYNRYNGYIPIIIVTPIHRLSHTTNSEGSRGSNSIGLYLDDYVDAIKELSKYYCIPVFDAYSLIGLDPNNESIKDRYMPDGLHPNPLGHKLLGEALYQFMRTINIPTI